MASFGRNCEKITGSIADFVDGVNTRLDENHLVDMIVTLKDEEITVSEFEEFTETIKKLRSGKKNSKTATTSTNG